MNICIIDDHWLMAQSIKRVLVASSPLFDVRLYRSAEEFLADDFSKWKPNIILCDIVMPGLNGVDLMDKAKATGGKFVLLTSITDSNVIKNALDKGANGYLTKDISEDELIDAIHTIHAGGQYLNKTVKDKVLEHFLYDNQPSFNLSRREKEVLQLACSGNTPKEIADKMNLSIYTVKQYIQNIMHKFKVNRATEMVVLAIKHGMYNPQMDGKG